MIEIDLDGSFENWQTQARELLRKGTAPSEIIWKESTGQQALFASAVAVDAEKSPRQGNRAAASTLPVGANKVPARFLSLAKKAAFHRDSVKWPLLYSVLWRVTHENHDLVKVETDDEVSHLLRMEDQVSRDEHHMHAFVRFKSVSQPSGEVVYVAWYRPDHKIIKLAAPFFRARFASMRWSILTPDGSAHWDGKELRYAEGVEHPPEASEDGMEKMWNSYYATTFNPARTNLRMMRSEMPVRHWQQMPELANLPGILAQAPQRVDDMIKKQQETPGASAFIPPQAGLREMREAIQGCQGCELYKYASQAVFGEGPANAKIVLIGEQPGDMEDRAGKPFVGPAGEILNKALIEVGLDRSEVYVTNAVKHFAFDERGKRRIHRTPRMSEIVACRPWLEAELDKLHAEILVCLGASAAKTVLGAQFRLTQQRGTFVESKLCAKTLATYHPSAVLRADSPESRDSIYQMLVQDLRLVVKEAAPAKHKHAAP